MQRLTIFWSAALCFLLFASGCSDILELPLDAAVQAENGLSEESNFAVNIAPKSGKISILGNDGNVYILNQAGGDVDTLTTDANFGSANDQQSSASTINYLLPTWSTTGQKLAYAKYQVTTQGEEDFAQGAMLLPISNRLQQRQEQKTTFTIFVTDSPGASPRSIWSGTARPIYMYWSPDNQYLSVLLQEGNSPNLQLTLISTADSSVSVIDVGSPMFWDWAPNGKQLMTHIGSAGSSERISMLELGDPVAEEIISINTSQFMSPDLSPDGLKFALPIEPDEAGDDDTWVAIFDVEGKGRRVIDRLDGSAFITLNFSPDGQKLAYIASKAGDGSNRGELVVFDLIKGTQKISEAKNITSFFWAPDSQKIAWIANGQNTRSLSVYDVETADVIDLIPEFETTSAFNEVIAFYSQYQRSATIWSPNSQHLVLPVIGENSPEIKIIHASGKVVPRTLAQGTLAFWSAD